MKRSNIKYLILSSLFLCSLAGFASGNNGDLPKEVQEELLKASKSAVTHSALTTQYDYSSILYPTIVSANGANLDVPEQKYSLYKNIAFSATGTVQNAATTEQECMIKISANDVTLDLQGFTLSTDKAALTAIIIEPNVTHVTIKNGTIGISASSTETTNFLHGILCREGCSDITLEDIVIEKVVGGNPIDFTGTAGSHIKTVTLRNVASNKHSGAVPYAINFDYVDKISIENLSLNFNTSTSELALFDVDNCNDITMESCEATFNTTTHDSAATAWNFFTCNNVAMNNVNVHNNTEFTSGIRTQNINNSTFNNISFNNNSLSKNEHLNAIFCSTNNDMTISNIICSNNSHTGSGTQRLSGFYSALTSTNVTLDTFLFNKNSNTNGEIFGARLFQISNLSAKNVTISNNTSTENNFTGIEIYTCPKSYISNIDVSNNTSNDSTTHSGKGISLAISSSSMLEHVNVSENYGGYQQVGIFVFLSNNCTIQNCTLNHNVAGTGIAGVGQTAGVGLVNSSYNLIKNCEASYNLGGDRDGSAAGVDADTTDSGGAVDFSDRLLCAGFVDFSRLEVIPNRNNIFDNCTARGNQTQWLHEAGTLPANVTSSGRFATQYALAAGFYLQSTRGAIIRNCVAEQNGGYHGTTANAYVA